jgi:hypothetical protein
MFKRIHQKLGTAGFVISIVALVAALGGGAYAASGGHATASAKQGKQGKQGKPGKTGPAGPAGSAGPQGPAGAKGDAGANGTNGVAGTNGKSVALGTATAGECPGSNPTGGVTVEVEGSASSKKKVCNGKEGSPWTAGGTLPSEKTETGTWAAGNLPTVATEYVTPVSFPIPLAAGIAEADTEVIAEGGSPTANCPGTPANPQAAAGKFCLYVTIAFNLETFAPVTFAPTLIQAGTSPLSPAIGVGKSGGVLSYSLAPQVIAYGTWAVTAP